MKPQPKIHQEKPNQNTMALFEVLAASAKLGLTSFGGPIAHLGYFHEEYVNRRKWLDEHSFTDLVALCQFLPGPASSQLGISIGILRAGMLGGIVAWLGFTLPSAIALVVFAFFLQGFDVSSAGWIHGLKIVAVAIVAQAIFSMGQKLTPDRSRATIAIISMAVVLLWKTAFSQITVIIAAALIGFLLYRKVGLSEIQELKVFVSRKVGVACLILFFALLVFLPIIRQSTSNQWVAVADSFYRSGSLVFGGGHVVLPLLQKEVVPAGWVSQDNFLAGYAATQAIPGPLFAFAAYLGAMMNGMRGAILATLSIFLPGFLLIIGALPFWNLLRKSAMAQGALTAINAAVVGILLAALYDPIWLSAVLSPLDLVLAAALMGMLMFWKLPSWIVVIAGAFGGMFL
ncbi:MAG: chromate transporter [Smithellaceae bacterium]